MTIDYDTWAGRLLAVVCNSQIPRHEMRGNVAEFLEIFAEELRLEALRKSSPCLHVVSLDGTEP